MTVRLPTIGDIFLTDLGISAVSLDRTQARAGLLPCHLVSAVQVEIRNSLCHVTGGGLPDNLPRVLPARVALELELVELVDVQAIDHLREVYAALRKEIARVITMTLPARHWVDIKQDVNPAHLRKVLLSTYEANPQNFEQLLAIPGVGPKAVRALALVAEVVYGSPASMRDPARFSFAHGGKDGHPYPVNRQVYDQSVEWLRDAVSKARIGHSERLKALRRLTDSQ